MNSKPSKLTSKLSIVRLVPTPGFVTPAEKPSEMEKRVSKNPFIRQMQALADAIDKEVQIILKI